MANDKYVWDASALVAALNSRDANHTECYSFWRNHEDAVYIFPALAWFEFQATQSRALREGKKALRELYILDEKNRIVDVNTELVRASAKAGLHERFSKLRGADLIYACIAALEEAPLVTVDNHFANIDGLDIILLGATGPDIPVSIERNGKTFNGTYCTDYEMIHVTYRGRKVSAHRSPGSSSHLARVLLAELVEGFAESIS